MPSSFSPTKSSPKPKSTNSLFITQDTILQRQKGSIALYIILIIVVIFAVMLGGGGHSLLSGDVASPVTPTVEPTAEPTPGPTDTPSPALDWKLNVNLKGCQITPAGMAIEILPEGSKNGYITIEIEITPGNFLATAFTEFVFPKQAYTYVLPNARGYNAKKWQIALFEGGTLSGTTWSGGIFKKSVPGNATLCR